VPTRTRLIAALTLSFTIRPRDIATDRALGSGQPILFSHPLLRRTTLVPVEPGMPMWRTRGAQNTQRTRVLRVAD